MLEFLGWQCIVDHCPARQCTCQAVTEAPCNARGSICLSHDNEGEDEESR